jgi:hypothetical protein
MLRLGERRALRVPGGRFFVPPRDAGVGGVGDDEISSTITAPVMKGTRGGDSYGPISGSKEDVQITITIMLLIIYVLPSMANGPTRTTSERRECRKSYRSHPATRTHTFCHKQTFDIKLNNAIFSILQPVLKLLVLYWSKAGRD